MLLKGSNIMFCVKCGKEIPQNGKFCMYCGEQIQDFEEKETEIQVDNSNITTKEKIYILVISILALGMAIYLLVRQGIIRI